MRIERAFGLAAHLRAIPEGKTVDIRYDDYSPNVVWVTIARLKKEGYNFSTKRIRENRWKPYNKLRVTRLEYGTNIRTKTDCDSDGGLSEGAGLHTISGGSERTEGV